MYLKALTINGFKSFAKKGELEFTTPITAIVGPNGSGKSNIAEAFRFVLGEQSIKSMRGKKGEDLIFNGSESVSRSNRASVSIVLENAERNGTRVFPLDFDEISIERVVLRDGTNEYSINGGKTRLKDVQELLSVANIGPTGHHIISQGEADRILSASARERREMIEDALGLKVYQFKKAESERKLKKTQENITQVESLRREVAPHLKFLERQVKKIERSLELQEELKKIYAEYLKREDSYIAFHFDKRTEERYAPQTRLREVEILLKRAQETLASHGKDDQHDHIISIEKDMSGARHLRQETLRAIGQCEGQMVYIERKIAESHARKEASPGSPVPFQEFKQVVEDIEKNVERSVQGGDSKILTRVVQDIVSVLRTVLHRSIHKGDDTGLAHDEKEHRALAQKKTELDTELHDIIAKEEVLLAQYNTLKADVEAKVSKNRDAEHTVFALMNETRELEQKIDFIDRELMILDRDRTEFKRELQEAVSLIGRGASLYFEYQILDEQNEALSREQIVCEERTVQIERRRTLERMKIRLEELGMGSNDEVLKEYKNAKERDEFLAREITDLTESVGKLQVLIADLTVKLNEQFVAGIGKIGEEFGKFFVLMFGGGSALLKRVKPKVQKKADDELLSLGTTETEATEEDTELEEGIEIEVKLPNKRVHGLDMLSGGERALTSIALIFAMSQVNPPLFVILDETDAALDEANSRRYGDMVSALAERSQLILITHNRETMSRAGVLYGITMAGDGVSKLLSVKFDEAVVVAK